MDIKLDRITSLNKSLKLPMELGGNFIPDESKPQFDFMFIGEMPSMRGLKNGRELRANDNFKGDKLLNEMMAKYGVGGSYVTDIVKERGKPGRPTKEQIAEWLPFLLKEIEIIKPKHIIVLGKGNYERNFKPFIEPRLSKAIKTDWVFHYSTQVPRLKFKRRFREVISRLKNSE